MIQDENSSLLAVDAETGKTVWESPRPDATGSFGTPILWQNNGEDQIVMPGSVRLKGYELKTGRERWVVEGLTGFACTTPVSGDGLLFFAGWSPGQNDAPWPAWESFLAQHDKNRDGVITFDEFDEQSRDFYRGLDTDHGRKKSPRTIGTRSKPAPPSHRTCWVAVGAGWTGRYHPNPRGV